MQTGLNDIAQEFDPFFEWELQVPVAHEKDEEPPPIRTIFNIQAKWTQNNTWMPPAWP